MSLSQQQLATLKAYIAAQPELANQPQSTDGNQFIADAVNAIATPDYFVWRTNVTRSDIYHSTSLAGTNWEWNTYKAQTVPEQGAWVQMFMGDSANFSLMNLRSGVGKIFTGNQAQNDQRDHCFAVGRRKATIAEKLMAVAVTNPVANSGNNSGQARGSAANPDVMGFEGGVTKDDVDLARRS